MQEVILYIPNHDLRSECSGVFQVWKFLITFADVLDLWPFTLDEFLQAFHDYVS